MNPEQNHKTMAYVILGIVVVIVLGVYIYLTLSNVPSPQQTQPAEAISTSIDPVTRARQATLVPFTPTQAPAAQTKKEQSLLKKY